MKIAKTRYVKTPQRGTPLSAGIDFFVPLFDEEFVNDLCIKNNLRQTPEKLLEQRCFKLIPEQRVLIPAGIKVNFEGEPKMLVAFNKSGIATKKGLDVLACVVDQDYMGEIHISLVNTSGDDVNIMENEKIVQFILIPVFYDTVEEVDENELWKTETERGVGGFGSTNNKQ